MGYKKRKKDKPKKPNDDWSKHVFHADQTNALFEAYYRHLVPPEEWEAFLATLRTPLPVTFWINSGSSGGATRDFLRGVCKALEGVEIDGAPVSPPTPLPFYPEELAWQVNIPRVVLRKNEHLKGLHEFLIHQTAVGNITRQEAVSMLPCLALDVRPGHKVRCPPTACARARASSRGGGSHAQGTGHFEGRGVRMAGRVATCCHRTGLRTRRDATRHNTTSLSVSTGTGLKIGGLYVYVYAYASRMRRAYVYVYMYMSISDVHSVYTLCTVSTCVPSVYRLYSGR